MRYQLWYAREILEEIEQFMRYKNKVDTRDIRKIMKKNRGGIRYD